MHISAYAIKNVKPSNVFISLLLLISVFSVNLAFGKNHPNTVFAGEVVAVNFSSGIYFIDVITDRTDLLHLATANVRNLTVSGLPIVGDKVSWSLMSVAPNYIEKSSGKTYEALHFVEFIPKLPLRAKVRSWIEEPDAFLIDVQPEDRIADSAQNITRIRIAKPHLFDVSLQVGQTIAWPSVIDFQLIPHHAQQILLLHVDSLVVTANK